MDRDKDLKPGETWEGKVNEKIKQQEAAGKGSLHLVETPTPTKVGQEFNFHCVIRDSIQSVIDEMDYISSKFLHYYHDREKEVPNLDLSIELILECFDSMKKFLFKIEELRAEK
jgi:hypothetical protein